MLKFPWVSDPSLEDKNPEQSLAQQVREEILRLILLGEIRAGQRLSEPDIAKRLGVSRVPVREALRSLQPTGLVVSKLNSGVFVRQLTPAEIHDLYEMRRDQTKTDRQSQNVQRGNNLGTKAGADGTEDAKPMEMGAQFRSLDLIRCCAAFIGGGDDECQPARFTEVLHAPQREEHKVNHCLASTQHLHLLDVDSSQELCSVHNQPIHTCSGKPQANQATETFLLGGVGYANARVKHRMVGIVGMA